MNDRLTGNSTTCPHCGADLRGVEIPEKSRESFGGATHFLRVIGVYNDVIDGTVGFQCPDCGAFDKWAGR